MPCVIDWSCEISFYFMWATVVCHSCSVFAAPTIAMTIFRKYNRGCLSKLKLVAADASFPAPSLKVTTAPLYVAARTEDKLVGNVGDRSAFCNEIFLDISLESKLQILQCSWPVRVCYSNAHQQVQ